MTARQQWTVVAAVIAVLGLGLAIGVHYMGGDLFPVEPGSRAPEFTAKVLNGSTTRTFADYKNKVVLLNVWATWCGPCIQEIPSLEKLYKEYGPKGLQLVAVSIDGSPGYPKVSEDSIARFARNLGVTFTVLHDSTAAIEKAYQVTGYPETFVIGTDGRIRKKWIGADDWSSQGNRALIAQLLGIETPKAIAASGGR
ncbi:MAG TPA: TlpA disulfide reductase family protein [Gemmatimonadaceae bacterium]|nr:TlpA disulfide reductase family protein [Gemmatimonadaceae bacterium]